jgi:hypothetical protein
MNLSTGTRLRSTFDFGLVTLSVNGLRPDDSAIYTCKATNLLGEAVSTCTLKVEGNKRNSHLRRLAVNIICVPVFYNNLERKVHLTVKCLIPGLSPTKIVIMHCFVVSASVYLCSCILTLHMNSF